MPCTIDSFCDFSSARWLFGFRREMQSCVNFPVDFGDRNASINCSWDFQLVVAAKFLAKTQRRRSRLCITLQQFTRNISCHPKTLAQCSKKTLSKTLLCRFCSEIQISFDPPAIIMDHLVTSTSTVARHAIYSSFVTARAFTDAVHSWGTCSKLARFDDVSVPKAQRRSEIEFCGETFCGFNCKW